jgi:hypothetical protein
MQYSTSLKLAGVVVFCALIWSDGFSEEKPGAENGEKSLPTMTVLLEDSEDKPVAEHKDPMFPSRVSAKAAGEFAVKEDGFLIGQVDSRWKSGVSINLTYSVYRNDVRLWSDTAFVTAPRKVDNARRNLDYEEVRRSLTKQDRFMFPLRKGDTVKWSYLRNPYELDGPEGRFNTVFARLAFRAFPSPTQSEP